MLTLMLTLLAQIQPEITDTTAPYTVSWGTLGLINAGIAQGKNRSGLNWFLLSLLLGPIATLLLVVVFKKIRQ